MEPQNKNPSNREQNPMSRERQREREPRDMERDMEKEEEGGQGGDKSGSNRPYPGWEEETRGTRGREPGGEEGDLGPADDETDEGMDSDRDNPR